MALLNIITMEDGMDQVTDKEKQLFEEIKKDPKAYEKLKTKCRWEHMTIFAVLRDYGDPRKW